MNRSSSLALGAAVSRREFIRWTVTAAGGLCLSTSRLNGAAVPADAATGPDFILRLLRPVDLLHFTLRGYGLWIAPTNLQARKITRVKPRGVTPSSVAHPWPLLVVEFPPQHIEEMYFDEPEKDKELPDFKAPIQAKMSGCSRLVFEFRPDAKAMADGLLEQPLTTAGFLHWFNEFSPRAEPAAPAEPVDAANKDKPRRVVPFRESALEIPSGLFLSTARERPQRWIHKVRDTPRGEPAELWHTTLQLGPVNGLQAPRLSNANWTRGGLEGEALREFLKSPVVPEGQQPYGVLRTATWRDSDFLTKSKQPLGGSNRLQLLAQTAQHAGVLRAEHLSLTARGAIAALHYRLDIGDLNFVENGSSGAVGGALVEWLQLIHLGRDQFVRVVESGYLLPFQHRAVFVKIGERKPTPRKQDPHKPTQPRFAVGHVRSFVLVLEPVRLVPSGALDEEDGHREGARVGRALGLRSVRVCNVQTPDLDPSHFDPDDGTSDDRKYGYIIPRDATRYGSRFKFDLEVEDAAGRPRKAKMALYFVGTLDKASIYSGLSKREPFECEEPDGLTIVPPRPASRITPAVFEQSLAQMRSAHGPAFDSTTAVRDWLVGLGKSGPLGELRRTLIETWNLNLAPTGEDERVKSLVAAYNTFFDRQSVTAESVIFSVEQKLRERLRSATVARSEVAQDIQRLLAVSRRPTDNRAVLERRLTRLLSEQPSAAWVEDLSIDFGNWLRTELNDLKLLAIKVDEVVSAAAELQHDCATVLGKEHAAVVKIDDVLKRAVAAMKGATFDYSKFDAAVRALDEIEKLVPADPPEIAARLKASWREATAARQHLLDAIAAEEATVLGYFIETTAAYLRTALSLDASYVAFKAEAAQSIAEWKKAVLTMRSATEACDATNALAAKLIQILPTSIPPDVREPMRDLALRVQNAALRAKGWVTQGAASVEDLANDFKGAVQDLRQRNESEWKSVGDRIDGWMKASAQWIDAAKSLDFADAEGQVLARLSAALPVPASMQQALRLTYSDPEVFSRRIQSVIYSAAVSELADFRRAVVAALEHKLNDGERRLQELAGLGHHFAWLEHEREQLANEYSRASRLLEGVKENAIALKNAVNERISEANKQIDQARGAVRTELFRAKHTIDETIAQQIDAAASAMTFKDVVAGVEDYRAAVNGFVKNEAKQLDWWRQQLPPRIPPVEIVRLDIPCKINLRHPDIDIPKDWPKRWQNAPSVAVAEARVRQLKELADQTKANVTSCFAPYRTFLKDGFHAAQGAASEAYGEFVGEFRAQAQAVTHHIGQQLEAGLLPLKTEVCGLSRAAGVMMGKELAKVDALSRQVQGAAEDLRKQAKDELQALLREIRLFNAVSLDQLLGPEFLNSSAAPKITSTRTGDQVEVKMAWDFSLPTGGGTRNFKFQTESGKSRLVIDRVMRINLRHPGAPVSRTEARITPACRINLFEAIEIAFGELVFRQTPDGKVSIDGPAVKGVRFAGKLSFVSALEAWFNKAKGSLPIRVEGDRVGIGRKLTLAPIPLGGFIVQNVWLENTLWLPLGSGGHLTYEFNFCSIESPFQALFGSYTGVGYFLARANAQNGISRVELSIGVGGGTQFSLGGVAEGAGLVSAGIRFAFDKKEGTVVSAYLAANGHLTVLGFIGFYMSALLMLDAASIDGRQVLKGIARFTVSYSIGPWDYSVSFEYQRVLAGSESKDNFADTDDAAKKGAPLPPSPATQIPDSELNAPPLVAALALAPAPGALPAPPPEPPPLPQDNENFPEKDVFPTPESFEMYWQRFDIAAVQASLYA